MRWQKYFWYLFGVLLLTFSLSTRKVFLTAWSPSFAPPLDYTFNFVYISDLVLLCLGMILVYKHWVAARLTKKLYLTTAQTDVLFYIVFLFVLGVFSCWSNGLYFALFLPKAYIFIKIYILLHSFFILLSKFRKIITSLYLLLIVGIVQSLVAIYQFVMQKSLFQSVFWHKITQETILFSEAIGVAKLSVDGEKLIRAYGLLPHPNILGGFLVFTWFVTGYLFLLHRNHFLSRLKFKNKHWNIVKPALSVLFWVLSFFVQSLALVFTFSRSAWMAFLLVFILCGVLLLKYTSIVSRETLIRKKVLLVGFMVILPLFFMVYKYNDLFQQRVWQNVDLSSEVILQNNVINDRIFYNNVSRETFFHFPIIGSGIGTSAFYVQPYLEKYNKDYILETWQYQPAHNIFWLYLSETGLVGFMCFLFILGVVLREGFRKIVSRETIEEERGLVIVFISVFVGFLFISCFDHYFYTNQPGILLFWLCVAYILGDYKGFRVK